MLSVGAVTHDSAGDVFADYKNVYYYSFTRDANRVTGFSRVVVECEDTGLVNALTNVARSFFCYK